jgi:DNA-directed RNA polymerase subunit RPC12/RpoP
MKQISASKVYVNFECLSCKREDQCTIEEAVENSYPICPNCSHEMDIVDCEIDSNK